MNRSFKVYPDECQLCGAPRRRLDEGGDLFHHSVTCNWRNDPSWRGGKKPAQSGQLALDVRWSNGSSMVNATITQEQYQRILAITQEKS